MNKMKPIKKIIMEFELPSGQAIAPEGRDDTMKLFMGFADLMCANMANKQGLTLNSTITLK